MTIVTHWDQMYMCVFANDRAWRLLLLKNSTTWSETYFRQDLFPAYLFFRRQFHAIVIFGFKSISDLDSGSLPRFFGEFICEKLKIVVS